MEKLYCVDFEYTIKGICHPFFKFCKKREVTVLREAYDKFLIATQDTIAEKIEEYITKKIKNMKQTIEKEGKVTVFNYYDLFSINLEKINEFQVQEFSYSEATIQECIENLTPEEYSRLYGNILAIGNKND